MVEDQVQKESKEKIEPSLEIPIWYFKINSKFLRNNKRAGFLFVCLIVGFYVFAYLFTTTTNTILSGNLLPLIWFGIILFVFFLIVVILSKYMFKGRKIELREKLAFNFFNLYNSLRKNSYGKELELSLKQDINDLIRVLKESDKSKLIWGEEDLLIPIETCIKDLDKINYLVKKPSENSKKLEEIISDLYELSVRLNNSCKIKTPENIDNFKKLANHLEEIEVQKLKDKMAAQLKQFAINYFPAYGFLILIVLGLATAISLFINTALASVISGIFVAVMIFWLQDFLGRNKS